MRYISKKDKARDFITRLVLPAVKQRDLDYNKAVSWIARQTNLTLSQVEDLLKTIPGIQEIRVLALSDDKIIDWLKDERAEEEAIKELLG